MSWYKPESRKEKILNSLLRPLSVFYFLGTLCRLKGYERKLLRQKRLTVPVLSIGNLTVGGTGKTPITIDLARSLIRLGFKVAVLSRGYKRQSNQKVLVVSDGKRILVDAAQAGDEPYLIARSVPGAVVIVSADRHDGGLVAERDYGCDLLILDDGFQHLKVARNFDAVVYDYNDDPSDLKLLPSGRLREPLASLSRADCLVISKLPDNPDPQRLSAIRLMANRYKPGIPVLTCRFEVDGLHRVFTNQKVTVTTRGAGTRVYAFCGIARPEGFYSNLQESGCLIVGKKTFADHHWLSSADMSLLVEEFEKSGAQYIVTTEKDRVRLPADFIDRVPLAELALSVSWGGKEIIELPALRAIIKKRRESLPGVLR